MRAGRRLDQVAGAGRVNLDPVQVARQDRIEDAEAGPEVELLRDHGPVPGSRVVGMGAGARQSAIARAGAGVVGVGVSPPMPAQLRATLAHEGVTGVEVVEAGFLDHERARRPADVVHSPYARHHLPDVRKGIALARMCAVLRPGGVLRVWEVVRGFEPAEAEARLAEAGLAAGCATGGADLADAWSCADHEEHLRDEHCASTWVFEALAQHAGLVLGEAE